jgi:D-3-phosphoglycerate dehydrogenase
MKILANDGISDDAIEKLKESGYEVITDKVNQSDLISSVNDNNYEIILVRSATTIRKEVIDSCPNLKLVGRGGVGMDNIDVNYAIEKGIKVINTPAASSQSVAELVIGNMFTISRFIGKSAKNIENGDFNKLKKEYGSGVELRGKTLGIIGFGRIGQTLASYALGIGMKVVAIDTESITASTATPVNRFCSSKEIPSFSKVALNSGSISSRLSIFFFWIGAE